MSKIWRWIAPAALAGGLVAAGTIPALASPAAYSVTISATSPNYPGNVRGLVDGYALVIYKTTVDNVDQGTISGTVTGFASGDVVSLLQEPFGKKAFTPTGLTATLSTTGAYSFTVTPSLATKYEVQVSTGTTLDVTSGTQTVYVEAGEGSGKSHKKCDSSSCTFSYKIYVYIPASAYKVESRKHVYNYLAQWYSASGSPKWFYLSTSARTSKPKKVNSGEIEYALTFYIHLRSGPNYWQTFSCTKDSESKDGLGLPGRHGCGDKRINADAVYVG